MLMIEYSYKYTTHYKIQHFRMFEVFHNKVYECYFLNLHNKPYVALQMCPLSGPF